MKILIFTWRDIKNPKAGGSEVYFHELAKRWIKLGNRVQWISAGWKNCKKQESIDGVKINRVGGEMSLYLLAPFIYLSLKEKPEIIIDNENGIPFFTPLFSLKRKFLHIHHNHKEIWKTQTESRGLKDKLLGKIGYFLENILMPRIYRNISVITISPSSKEEISKGYKKIAGVVNPGIEFYKYKKISKSKNPSILFLNRIKRYKGVKTLLDASVKLRDIKNLEVLIAGEGDDLEEMKEYARKKEIKNVKFLGRISEEKKQELMQKTWVFINPSSKEGWGIVNIEANYFGTPVIGSNVSGIKDSVIHEKTGLLFEHGNDKDLAEKIRVLLHNKKLREKMGKTGKEWALKFDWDKKAKEYLKILKETG
jgi:glycosyltransferase involved in cell wall biosynthesis